MGLVRKVPENMFLIFILVVSFISCREKSEQDLILGNWKLVIDSIEYDQMDQSPPAPFAIPGRGISYTFLNDSIVDTRMAYYKIIRHKGRRREIRFIGTKTNYKIIDDSLKIYDLTDSVWRSAKKITRITNDTLILTKRDGQKMVFVRHDYNLDMKPCFDQISLSSSGCYGSCPVMNIIIDSTGHVVYHGEMYVDKVGFYEGQITKEKFLNIEREFRKANVKDLSDQYSASWTDDETISTTFCRQHKIVKSVEDYGRTAPDELVWAYPSLRYLFQELDLKQIDSTKIPIYLNLRFFGFEKGKKFLRLTQSESFLVWNYLRNGTVAQSLFNQTFELSFTPNHIWQPSNDEIYQHEKKVRSIKTDGRFYTFDLIGQKAITIDIGFNYISENNGLARFHEKKAYE